jgi:hypothetical protein
MKTLLKTSAAAAFILAGVAGSASAQMMDGDKMMGMMQCSAACNTEYMQCLMASQQMTSDPTMAMGQVQSNFQNATACGQAAMACQASCN